MLRLFPNDFLKHIFHVDGEEKTIVSVNGGTSSDSYEDGVNNHRCRPSSAETGLGVVTPDPEELIDTRWRLYFVFEDGAVLEIITESSETIMVLGPVVER